MADEAEEEVSNRERDCAEDETEEGDTKHDEAEGEAVQDDNHDYELDDSAQSSGGTRLFPRFDIQHPFSYCFEKYLMSIDGGERNEKSAREMSIDVFKYLRYACGDCPSPDWGRLVDCDQLIGYMEKLKRAKVGPEGRLAKLDHLLAVIRYMRLHVIVEHQHPLYHKFMKFSLVGKRRFARRNGDSGKSGCKGSLAKAYR